MYPSSKFPVEGETNEFNIYHLWIAYQDFSHNKRKDDIPHQKAYLNGNTPTAWYIRHPPTKIGTKNVERNCNCYMLN